MKLRFGLFIVLIVVLFQSTHLVAGEIADLPSIEDFRGVVPSQVQDKKDTACNALGKDEAISDLSKKEELENLTKNIDVTFSYLVSCGTLVRITETKCPRVYGMVRRCCDKLNMRVPAVFVFKGNFYTSLTEHFEGADFRCNAFASAFPGIGSLVVIGEDLAKNLSDSELEAVIAHELGHIYHYHIIKRLFYSLFIAFFLWEVVGEISQEVCFAEDNILLSILEVLGLQGLPIGKCVTYPVTVISELIFNAWHSKKCEKEADLAAIKIIEKPEALGQALDSIAVISANKPRFWPWIKNKLIGSHPLVWERKSYMNDAIKQM